MEELDGNGEENQSKEYPDDGNVTNEEQDVNESPEINQSNNESIHLETSSVSATPNPEGEGAASQDGNDEQGSGSNVVSCETAMEENSYEDSGNPLNITASDNTPVNAGDVSADLEKNEDSGDQQQPEITQTIMSDKEESNKDVMEKDADEEVDEFFQQSPAPAKKFPGLDNVDLTSDDEGQEALQDLGADGDDGQTQEAVQNVEDGDGGASNQDEPCYCSEDEELSKSAAAPKSPLKDYPINVGNYKVCRQVEPGVKECIILETGEQIKCFTKSKSPTSSLSSTSILQTEPQSTSSPRTDLGSPKTNNSPRNTQQQSVSSSNASENFEYQSFPDGSASTIIAAAESSNLNDVGDIVRANQHIFINEDGTPVIMDNTEDDVKINIQAQMDRVSKAVQSLQRSRADLVADTNTQQLVVKDAEDVVWDVLSSGGDGEGGNNHSLDEKLMHVKKSKRKRDKERYYELQPDKFDNSDDKSEPERLLEVNRNNNSNVNNNNAGATLSDSGAGDRQVVEGEAVDDDVDDVNNSANNSTKNQLAAATGSADMSRSSRSRSPHNQGSSYYDDIHSWSRSHRDAGLSERHSPSVLRGSNLHDTDRYLPSRRGNLYSRYDDSTSSLEASRISTRYSLLDRGQHNSSPSSGTKQVSWHDMFKMIEEQHRSQQQQQYLEHQRILQEMQENMKQELSKQQDTLKDRLNKYNEMLEELSLGRQDGDRGDSSPSVSSGQEDNGMYNRDASHTTLDGVPIALRYPPPLSGCQSRYLAQDSDDFGENLYDQTPVRRCLEKVMTSPPRPADTSLRLSQVSLGEDKQLRGGVYSSPMPLAKAKHKSSPKATNTKSYVKSSSSQHSPRDKEEAMPERHTPIQNFSLNAANLTSENAELRQRCQDLEDACHDRKIEIRELTQKIQGLERRAADCTERYELSQSQVMTLHNRLEELTEYAKERDGAAADMEIRAKQSSESLQSAHKREKELTDSLQAAKVTIRKLVEKYEMMEKDHDLLKESYKDQEQSLNTVRKEMREVNSKLSSIELENKQLIHEKDVLKHDLTMARSSPTKTNFEEALQKMSANQRKSPANKRGGTDNMISDRAYGQEQPRKIQDFSLTESSYNDSQHSPIMKAEMELYKLRESMANGKEFMPKLQRKFYGTDVPRSSYSSYRGPSAPSPNRHADKMETNTQAPKSSSPRDSKKGQTKALNRNLYPTGSDSDLTGDQAIKGVKAGEIISRPAWEDMYTSMAPASKKSQVGTKAMTKKYEGDVSNAMRESSLKERLQSIESLERKYDDLISDKRKFESALTRVRPGQSHRREKERLETELDRVDRELGSIRMSLKRFHVLKSSI